MCHDQSPNRAYMYDEKRGGRRGWRGEEGRGESSYPFPHACPPLSPAVMSLKAMVDVYTESGVICTPRIAARAAAKGAAKLVPPTFDYEYSSKKREGERMERGKVHTSDGITIGGDAIVSGGGFGPVDHES